MTLRANDYVDPLRSPLTFWGRMTTIDRQIIKVLHGASMTCKQLSEAINVQDTTYGKVMAPARRLVSLRAWGLVSDVSERCACCNSALSRGQRNVPLSLTEVGRDFYAAILIATQPSMATEYYDTRIRHWQEVEDANIGGDEEGAA
jgi:hypothetical protein